MLTLDLQLAENIEGLQGNPPTSGLVMAGLSGYVQFSLVGLAKRSRANSESLELKHPLRALGVGGGPTQEAAFCLQGVS